MLRKLELENVGPTDRLEVEFASRLNVLTGDNGLGKTFLLDTAWWALTASWAGAAAFPRDPDGSAPQPTISWTTESGAGAGFFAHHAFEWRRMLKVEGQSCLAIYARVDGSFAVFDPLRGRSPVTSVPPALSFDHDAVWNGMQLVCNGLVRDWVAWQNDRRSHRFGSPFKRLKWALKRLSPDGGAPIRPGEPRRIDPSDAREHPTLALPYGEVPAVHAAAGMRRILGFAYLIAWAWTEHQEKANLLGESPAERFVLLVDEVETHLHVRWQRQILPALLDVVTGLRKETSGQIIATTHSPLVLASLEPDFQPEHDRLFLFDLVDREVTLRPVPWTIRGDAVGWLVSEIFGLDQARSVQAERAIEAAEAWMRGARAELAKGLRSRDEIHSALQRYLPGDDPFWPRWVVAQ